MYNQTALKIVRIKNLASDEIRIFTKNLHLNVLNIGYEHNLTHLK